MGKLKICHISDSHSYHKELRIPTCDVLVCSGDISMMGWRHEVESFFRWIKLQAQCTHKILVVGNHDLSFDPERGGNSGNKPDWLLEAISQLGRYNIIYLENTSCEIEGVKFWGTPTSAEFCRDRWAFNLNQQESEALHSTIPLGVDVVITHGPAFGYGDWCKNTNGSVGDERLLYHIKRVRPLLHLFGHIHESYGTDLNPCGTHHFNGCSCDLSYQIWNEPWLIEADFDNKEVEVLNENA